MSSAGKILAVLTALMAASPQSVAADTGSCDIVAIASALSGSDPDTDPVDARKARRNRVTRDRHADVALAESGGKVSPIAVGRLIDEQFARFDPGYADNRAKSRARLDALKLRLDAAQGPGHWLYCSQQIYNDAEWLVEYTAFWPRAAAAMDELERSLAQPDQVAAGGQAADGSWGGCRREFIFRVDSTVDALNGLPPDPVPRLAHPLAFMEALASPADVGRLVLSRLGSTIQATGVYGREEIASLTNRCHSSCSNRPSRRSPARTARPSSRTSSSVVTRACSTPSRTL